MRPIGTNKATSKEANRTDNLFGPFLLVGNDDDIKIGTPVVDGATVSAKIVEQGRHAKVDVFKRKRRKGFHKLKGHRQPFTEVEITEING